MNKVLINLLRILLLVIAMSFSTGCTTAPPQHTDNICSIFQQYPRWYWTAQDVQKRWGIPISVLMAIIYQESHFRAGAKPPRTKLLWIIPWTRPTSAYGYSQATNGSWQTYVRSTGESAARRDAFSQAADFIGWYANYAHRKLGISPRDPYRLYLAYHEGLGGYAHKTYLQKRWLINVAHQVSRRARIYHYQLIHCIRNLPKKSWWRF